MKLREFLLHHTRAEELCVICDPWRCAAVWIDHEDLFIGSLSKTLLDSEVIETSWENLPVCDQDGWTHEICVRHIHVKR